jgi:hypothetical protein
MERKKHTQTSANLAGAAAPASPNVATPLHVDIKNTKNGLKTCNIWLKQVAGAYVREN